MAAASAVAVVVVTGDDAIGTMEARFVDVALPRRTVEGRSESAKASNAVGDKAPSALVNAEDDDMMLSLIFESRICTKKKESKKDRKGTSS